MNRWLNVEEERRVNIIADESITILGKNLDSHFAANLKNIERLNNNVLKTKQ